MLSFVAGACAQDFSLPARQADFRDFVREFGSSYAYGDRADKPWLTWEARYGDAVAKAGTKQAFDTVLAEALSELHDFHAEVRSPVPNRWLPVPTFADMWAEFRGDDAAITAMRQGSDAERAGVCVGDRVVAVDGVPLRAATDERLGSAGDRQNATARAWALLSVLTGRAEATRRLRLRSPRGVERDVTLQVERQFDRQAGPLSAEILPGNFGLIRFNNSLGEQATVAAFDAALERLRATQGLLLDLRDVPSGGDSSVALGILGRFTTRMLPYQRHRIPRYGQADVERNWVELAAPRGSFPYTAPVVVLVNHWTGSMGEGLAIGLDAMGRAVAVGTPMAHLAGAVSDYKLPRTGVDVAFATEQILHVNGIPRQEWLPPVSVVMPETCDRGDLILARGMAELQRAVAASK